MFKTVCSNCHKECSVPFKPSGDKPVYCSDCFEKIRGSSNNRRFNDRNFNKPRFEDRNRPPQNNEQFKALNFKLDKILTLLTTLNSAKDTSVIKPETVKEEVKSEVKDIEILPVKLLASEKPAAAVKKKRRASKKTALPKEV